MKEVVPWTRFLDVIEPLYPKRCARSRVEHPFPVIKRQPGYPMTRYRGLVKYRAQLFMLFTLGNLCLMRRKLMA
jgi:hypothetical protein